MSRSAPKPPQPTPPRSAALELAGPSPAELTLPQAAGLLNVPEGYLLQLIQAGEVPSRETGERLRLQLTDVQKLGAKRAREREAALERLVRLSEDAGGYDE